MIANHLRHALISSLLPRFLIKGQLSIYLFTFLIFSGRNNNGRKNVYRTAQSHHYSVSLTQINLLDLILEYPCNHFHPNSQFSLESAPPAFPCLPCEFAPTSRKIDCTPKLKIQILDDNAQKPSTLGRWSTSWFDLGSVTINFAIDLENGCEMRVIHLNPYKQKMFNFDNMAGSSYYGDQYCRYGYVYGAPCYYSDNNYAFNFPENPSQPSPYYAPSPYSFNYVPNYAPIEQEDLKCATEPTRDSEIPEDALQKEEQQMVAVVKNQECEDEPIKLEQKYGRNIASNIFHSIIRWATFQQEFQRLIEAAIAANRMTIKTAQFRQKLKQKTGHLKGYVNAKAIKSLYLGRKIGATRLDLQFSKILRILSKIYIKKYHINHIYYSSKIKRKSRSLHFKRMRVLLKMIK